MLAYYFRLGLISLIKNPVLSTLMILAIALGVGACMTTITVDSLLSAHPIPEKKDKIFYLRFDNRLTTDNIEGDKAERLPPWVTWREATNIVNAEKGVNQTAYQHTNIIVSPENKDIPLFKTKSALVNWGFFPMFNTPFLYGAPWSKEMEESQESIIIISKEMNDVLFDGVNSVGRSILIGPHTYKVVGVVDKWLMSPKVYDGSEKMYAPMDQFYIPLSLKEPLELRPNGNVMCFRGLGAEDDSVASIHASECSHLRLFVELKSPEDKEEYKSFLSAYVDEQRQLGRFQRSWDVTDMKTLSEWIIFQENDIKDTKIMVWLAGLFLFVCLLNTAALLFGKLARRKVEASLRRAIGASKLDLILQYTIEALVIGLIGGILGLAFTYFGVLSMTITYGEKLTRLISFDPLMASITVIIAIISTIVAGLIPAWRASMIAPATQLKSN